MVESRGLVKLGGLSDKDIAVYSRWVRFSTKITVRGRMDLVTDIDTDEKSEIRPNTLILPNMFWYIS